MTGCDWPALTTAASEVVAGDMRRKDRDGAGLIDYQVDVVNHVLRHLATNPGLIVAERTGRGKSLIATAVVAALAAAATTPFRVVLMAPSREVLRNWTGTLLPGALEPGGDTYLWRGETARVRWGCVSEGWIERDGGPLQVFAHHCNRGIANAYSRWSKTPQAIAEQAGVLTADQDLGPIDLLIVDEVHQLKSSTTGRARALKALFGTAGCPLPVRRVLALSATPFQLAAPAELARLIQILCYPTVHDPDIRFPPAVDRATGPGLAHLIDPYVLSVSGWLTDRIAGRDGKKSHEEALRRRAEVQSVLRSVMVRTTFRAPHVRASYGDPKPDPEMRGLPLAKHGLTLDDASERLMFLAWDGAIASRSTFISTEQQTLSSSAAALRNRDDIVGDLSATELRRRPLAPRIVQKSLAALAKGLATKVRPDHVKVRRTAQAVRARVGSAGSRRLPVLVFAERSATLQQLAREIGKPIGEAEGPSAAVVSGQESTKRRRVLVRRFNHQEEPGLDVLLASRVAEMGLDVDGPADKEDIWLIHHDFPWNPAMVDQRNGRVYRPAKTAGTVPVPAYLSYPFVRDTVDERIFKRMLLRQATAELLLGTDDVARSVHLASHSDLESIDVAAVTGPQLQALCPDLSPGAEAPAESEASTPTQEPGNREPAHPLWIPPELAAVAHGRGTPVSAVPIAVSRDLVALAAEQQWPLVPLANSWMVRVDLAGRYHTVALLVRKQRKRALLEALALADADVRDGELMTALRTNDEPGAAGLVLMNASTPHDLLLARATNLLNTLDQSELVRMVVEAARRADRWEAHFGGGEDRW